jgi:hypothetical protein
MTPLTRIAVGLATFLVTMVAFAAGSIYAINFLVSQPVVAALEPEPQECYIWAVDSETDREFLACPDPDHGNICYENMAEVMDNAVKFFTCAQDNN